MDWNRIKSSKFLMATIPAAAVLLVLVVYQYGYLRLEEEIGQATELTAVKMKTLEKSLTLLARKPALETKLTSLKEARRAEEVKLIQGQTPSVAAAALQNSLSSIITARGGTIASERSEKPEDYGKLKIISVTVDAVFPDTKALAETLYAIENQTPFLVVREMDSRLRNFREPRELTVKLRVSGLTGGR
jgi:hypothetical protein